MSTERVCVSPLPAGWPPASQHSPPSPPNRTIPGPLDSTLRPRCHVEPRGEGLNPGIQTGARSLVSHGNLRLLQIWWRISPQPARLSCFLCFYYKHIILIGKTLNTSFTVIKSKHLSNISKKILDKTSHQ